MNYIEKNLKFQRRKGMQTSAIFSLDSRFNAGIESIGKQKKKEKRKKTKKTLKMNRHIVLSVCCESLWKVELIISMECVEGIAS